MPTLESVIGDNVRDFRSRAGGTQAELGQALVPFLGGQGWTRQAVWKAERGERSFTAAELLALAGALGVTVPQLFESVEPVTLPSGNAVDPLVIEGLLAGTDSQADRFSHLRAEIRGMRTLNRKLQELVNVHGAQLVRAESAAKGTPEPKVEPDTKGDFGALGYMADRTLRRAYEIARTWALPPAPGQTLTDLDEEGDER